MMMPACLIDNSSLMVLGWCVGMCMQVNFMHINDLEELCFRHRLFSLLFAYVVCSSMDNMSDSLDEVSCPCPKPKTGKSSCTWKVSRI